MGSEAEFWLQASEASLHRIWDNPEDDVYAQILKSIRDLIPFPCTPGNADL